MNIEIDIEGHNFAGIQEMNTEYYILLTYQLHVCMLCTLVPGTDCTGTQPATMGWNWTDAEDTPVTGCQSHQREAPPLC